MNMTEKEDTAVPSSSASTPDKDPEKTSTDQPPEYPDTTKDDEKAKQDATPASHEDEEDEADYPHGIKLALVITSLCLAIFLVALDQTIIAPALGAITATFNSVKDIGWYGAAYLLTTTALQPIYGAIYKRFNVKIVFLLAVFIFEIGSVLTAAAPSSTVFIIGRAVAGIGTAGLFSGGIVILSYTMPLRKRPMVFGAIGGMWGIASVAGPLVGGAFATRMCP